MPPLKWDISQASEMFLAKEIMHKLLRYQIQQYWIDHYLKFLFTRGGQARWSAKTLLRRRLPHTPTGRLQYKQ